MLHCHRAGIDETLTEAMYGLLGRSSFRPIYAGVEDALRIIQAAGIANRLGPAVSLLLL